MQSLPVKQLIRTALVTAPLIAVIYVTPMYIFNVFPGFSFFVMWPIITGPILLAWIINILFLIVIKNEWILKPYRILLVSIIMFFISGIAISLVHPHFPVDENKALMIRIVNILSVNSIVHILIDLTITKENRNRIQLENTQLQFLKLEAENKAMKDQVNPHFLFNALTTLKSLITSAPETAEEYTVKLSELLRASLSNNEQKTITLSEEIKLCTMYLEMQKIRFGNALLYDISVSEKGNVPVFSIQSLVENAIKHNALTVEQPLKINIKKEEDKIIVSNNVQKKLSIENLSGMGLVNLVERYKILSGDEVIIHSDDKLFSVTIKILGDEYNNS